MKNRKLITKLIQNCIMIAALFSSTILFGQTIEIITPNPGFYFWKEICFSSEKVGYAKSEEGEIFKTIDSGKNWKLSTFFPHVKNINKNDEIIKLKNYYDSDHDKFKTLTKISDSVIVGISLPYNPLIIKTNVNGDHWKVLNGATNNSVSSILVNKNKILAVDSDGFIFYSDNNGGAFSKILNGGLQLHYWPKLKMLKDDIVYYWDNLRARLLIGEGFGKWWAAYSLSTYPVKMTGKLADIVLKDTSLGYFITENEVFKTYKKSSDSIISFTATLLKKGDEKTPYKFSKIDVFGDTVYVLNKQGSLLISKNDGRHWDTKISDSSVMFTNFLHKDNKYVITTSGNYIYYSDDGERFIKIYLPEDYKSYNCSIYKNYIITDLSYKTYEAKDGVFIYNTRTGVGSQHINMTGKYRTTISGLYENYIIGYAGCGFILKLNMD